MKRFVIVNLIGHTQSYFTLSCHFCRLTVYNVAFHLFVSKWQSAVHASAFVLHLFDTIQVSFHK